MDPIGYMKNEMFCQNFVMLLSFAFARIVILPKLVRQESEEAANCPICCGRLKHCVALIPCGHAFCKACVHPSCTQERFFLPFLIFAGHFFPLLPGVPANPVGISSHTDEFKAFTGMRYAYRFRNSTRRLLLWSPLQSSQALRQAWLKQSPSCPSCRSSVEDGQWVRVRVMDEVLNLLQSKAEGRATKTVQKRGKWGGPFFDNGTEIAIV